MWMWVRKLLNKNKHITSSPEMSHMSIGHLNNKPLEHGDLVPEFSFTPIGEEKQCIYDTLSKSPVVIVFFRGSWCPSCIQELRNIQQEIGEFNIKNIKVFAISPDDFDQTAHLKSSEDLSYQLISDKENRIAKIFDISIPLASTLNQYQKKRIQKQTGIDADNYEVPVPATYIIDKKGRILYHFVDFDYTKRVKISSLPDLVVKLEEKEMNQ